MWGREQGVSSYCWPPLMVLCCLREEPEGNGGGGQQCCGHRAGKYKVDRQENAKKGEKKSLQWLEEARQAVHLRRTIIICCQRLPSNRLLFAGGSYSATRVAGGQVEGAAPDHHALCHCELSCAVT